MDNCVSGKCQFKNTCCKDDKGCDDGDDKCTVDKCVGGKCNYTGTGVQGCCMPTIWGHSFDDNSATGMTFSNKYGAAKGWQVWNPATKYKSAKGVLYYGDPKVKNFKFSGANSGTATLKPVLIPSKKTATLRLWAYFGTEKSSTYDKLTIYGQPAGGAKSSIWVKTSSISTNVWHDLKIPLKSVFKGKKTTFSFYFNTSDGVGNTGLGVLIDDVKVEQACN